jgi:hypothetical protein
LETIGIWGEFLGGLGVIASLVFLAHQIRISNRLAVAASERELMGNFSSLNELFMGNNEASNLMAKLTDPDIDFDKPQTEKARAFVRRLANVWIAADESHRQGFLTDNTYKLLRDDVQMVLLTYPSIQSFFNEFLGFYPNSRGLLGYAGEVLKKENPL